MSLKGAKLKPCPRHPKGSTTVRLVERWPLYDDEDSVYMAGCCSPRCDNYFGNDQTDSFTEEDAIRRWNKRAGECDEST